MCTATCMFLADEAESGYMKRKNKRTQQKVKADVNLKLIWSLNILSGLPTNTLAVNRSHTDSVFEDSLWSIIGWTLSYIGREMIPTKSDLKIKEKKSKEKENTDIRGHALQGDRLHICIPDKLLNTQATNLSRKKIQNLELLQEII